MQRLILVFARTAAAFYKHIEKMEDIACMRESLHCSSEVSPFPQFGNELHFKSDDMQ